MTQRIFKSIITVSVTAVFFTIVIITLFLNRYFTGQVDEVLKSEALLISRAVEINGEQYLKSSEFAQVRVTWIDADGLVLYDSEAEEAQMENHSNREEFAEALKSGTGSSSRYSETLTQKTIYYARKLSDGTVIRVSKAYMSIWAQLAEMILPFIIIISAVLIFSGVFASKMAKRIVSPVNMIDLNNPDIDDSYPELSTLLQKIRGQNRKIARQMEQLRYSREQFGLITENMSEGIIIADTNTIVLSYNNAAMELLGAEPTEERQSIYALNRSEEFRFCIQNAIRGKHADCILKIGEKAYQVIANPSYTGVQLSGIVVFILDVTEKQQLEDMRREFTSNVSHELKTPLTSIYGISDMLANGIVKPEDVQKFGGDIRNEAGRMIILINDILSLSRLDENSVAEDDVNVDLYSMAQEIIGRLSYYAGERNITMNISGGSVPFRGRATILEGIIYNLCDNAIKYNRDGGSVSVTIGKNGNNAVITVEDTGIGIPAQHIDRIFERFYRVDKSHSRKIKGTGLGLSIVKHGVRYHNGTIQCESSPGEGTKFTVTMPVKAG
ncbi:MAG: PAS domain S-box protein [Ruminococcus sp.]|nr:PAS domain S-box protein [Ruminococcus sp.]